MRVTPEMIDPELRLRGRITDIVNTRSTEAAYRKHVRRTRKVLRLLEGRSVRDASTSTVDVPRHSGTGAIRTRIVRPPGDGQHAGDRPSRPGVLWLHGGGYAVGIPEIDANTHRILAKELGCIVVAPDYRLSIDAPYPAALDDCYDTLLWMHRSAGELGLDRERIVVGGGSAGGGLAAAISLRARDTGEVRIAVQLPLYPMIDDRMITDSARENDAPVWNSATNRWAWRLYLGDRAEDDVPAYAAPARAADLRGLPRTVTFVGDLDPFRDETIAYVERLRAADVPVDFELFEGCYHGFETVCPDATVSRRARAFWTGALERALER
ncbi:MAG: alpha/beta hydrolase, partial [Spirochaetota bacterium]